MGFFGLLTTKVYHCTNSLSSITIQVAIINSIIAHVTGGPSSSIKEAIKYAYHKERVSTKSAYHHLKCTPVEHVRLEYSPSCLAPQSFVPYTSIDPKKHGSEST